ncbi:hypothetical protein RhiirA5_352615 [Rhizophagus irregularis]|uniref:STB6-like N-terminal domain-containing protein n=2 Tax=Rhizophagus irregularis TaxID=588596 RepID=A0A2I1EAU7_9GLOM|nr:Stb6p [Rhizophagus irregularis DAOM 197198w]PKC12726.1 hypothetical protein RhiirA5_352615 [Rhizophagus irregularis]GBC42820.1 Sin3 complex subunit (Stb2), putative [Rhizophagus irregularis DAOM 181602=DAOM 197198]PKC74927.1 hypothetical protein RhiirA1_408396 [Rhizophagus irregularis]PKK66669.1 hypothetical protein RhiirC2_753088 [Rhizophagus irregularis]
MVVNSRYGKFVFPNQKSILERISNCGDGVRNLGEKELEGYQLYIVEQWACDKIRRPYNTIIVFTGDSAHKIKACVVIIEENKIEHYPEKLKLLFDSLEKDDMTRPKNSGEETIFVTNFNTFPSSLNTILVPDGDYEDHKFEFFLNLNLRKAGCSGRSALSLNPPTDAQIDKFIQTYAVSDSIPFKYAVLELVKLVQISLCIFGLLPQDCMDGLLCDSTEIALREFQNTYHPGIEIRDNILDPTLVAVILTKVVSIRNKLNSLGYQVGKDPFSDTDLFLSGVESFQNAKKINFTRKLDVITVEKIYEAYSRFRNPDAIRVHKVLKSKLDDISTGSSNTSTDIETCNLEEFGKNVQIERLKYLWRGKGDPPEQFLETYWLFHNSRDFGKELGKSILRGVSGVSGRTAKTGEAIRDGVLGIKDNVTGSFSILVDKRKEKNTYKSSSLPPDYFSQNQHNEVDISYNQGTGLTYNANLQNRGENYVSPTSPHEIGDASKTELSKGSEIKRTRSNSLSTYEFIAEAMSTRVLPSVFRRYSFTNMDLARKQADGTLILPRRNLDVDIQTYMIYDNLKQSESSLKSLAERLESTVEEYNKQIEELTKSYEERIQNFKSTETEGGEVLDKQRKLSKIVSQIGTNSAKLNYELGVLEEKLREVEEFADTFCLKVQMLQMKVPQSRRSVSILYNFLNYFQDQWKRIITRFYKPKEE